MNQLDLFSVIFRLLMCLPIIFYGLYQMSWQKFNILSLFDSNWLMMSAGKLSKGGNKYPSPPIIEKLRRKPIQLRSSDAPVLCTGCGIKTEQDIRD